MTVRSRSFWILLSFLCSFGIALAQEAIENWPAPAVWSLPGFVISKGEVSPSDVEAVEAVPTSPLHFVGITPCRVADTRGNGFTGQYGTPALTPSGRDMVITGRCGIPAEAQAVSFNFSAVNVTAAGFFVAYPAGGAFPPVATMTYNQNTPNLSNAAVVPLGTGGAITVVAAVTTIDLVIDVNGYYRPGVVTALNGLSGAVTLDSNFLSISTDGQSVFLDSGPGGVLPPGTQGQTLRHNGSTWQASSLLTNDGFDNIGVNSAALLFTPAVRIRANISGSHYSFLNNVGGSNNTFLGQDAGFADCCVQGNNNTGIGGLALNSINVGSADNTALGYNTMPNLSSGSGNIAIGTNIAPSLTTGSNNLYIGNPGSGNESGQIRIGRNDLHTQGTVIASIYGFGSSGGIPVIVNAGGRLGTTTSSARFKEDVRDIGRESDGLMSLRPVAFKYKRNHDPSGLRQYGLIAEEVAQIYPELVVYDEQGRPQAIRSQLFDGLFLSEIQKQHRKLEMQETTISEQTKLIERQQAQLDELRSELAKVQAKLSGN
jgi:hypothetical protein